MYLQSWVPPSGLWECGRVGTKKEGGRRRRREGEGKKERRREKEGNSLFDFLGLII